MIIWRASISVENQLQFVCDGLISGSGWFCSWYTIFNPWKFLSEIWNSRHAIVGGIVFRNSLFTRTGSQGFSAGEGRVVALARLHSVRKCLGTSSLSIDIKIHKFYLFDRVPFGMKRLRMGNSGCILFNTSRAFEVSFQEFWPLEWMKAWQGQLLLAYGWPTTGADE